MREVEHLNFEWLYVNNFKEEYIISDSDIGFEKVSLPHNNVDLPYNNFNEKDYQIQSCYKRTLFIDESKKGKKIFINFGGVMCYAKIYINGEFVFQHKGGYTPFKVDLTDVVKYGQKNNLVVCVDSAERKEIPPFGFVVDYLTYGGIYREVSLEYLEPIFIENSFIKCSDVLSPNKKLNVDVYIENYSGVSDKLEIAVQLEKNNCVTHAITKEIEVLERTQNKYSLSDTVKNILLWDTNNPNLYDIKIILKKGNIKIDERVFKFGFREAIFKEDGFYLNGNKLKIIGLNRHQSFPYVGYAMPKNAQYKDAEILKYELGVNLVRLSHYPQSVHFLNKCDEIGLLVFEEIPGWQHIGEKGEWWDIAKQNTEDMIKRDWNRPSIVIWGTRINESADCDELYTQTNNIAKKLDSTRQTGGVRCIGGSNLIEDVYTYNDFVYDGGKTKLDKRKKIANKQVPYLVTEFNGHMFPTKKYDNVGRRVEHALRHLEVIDKAYEDDEISGAIGWCMFDYNTHKEFGSGDKICYHGVLDMFRIEKYASAVYKSQSAFSPVMTVAQSMDNGDMDNSTRGDVYVFTNCDYIKLYVNGEYIKDFFPRKDLYQNLMHAPIIVDDFLGDAIEKKENFSIKDSKKVKELLMKADKYGEHLPLMDQLKLGVLFVKYKMTMKDGRDLYTKYFGGWGTASTTYTFDGYINNKKVISTTKSQVFKLSLKVTVDSDTLFHDETYDVTRFVVSCIDENGNDLVYSNDTFTVSTDSKLEIIGPKNLALIGGSIGFWVKTTGETGESTVTIKSERFGEIQKKLIVN